MCLEAEKMSRKHLQRGIKDGLTKAVDVESKKTKQKLEAGRLHQYGIDKKW